MKALLIVAVVAGGFAFAASPVFHDVKAMLGFSADPIERCESIWWSDSARVDCLINVSKKANQYRDKCIRDYIAAHGAGSALRDGVYRVIIECKIPE